MVASAAGGGCGEGQGARKGFPGKAPSACFTKPMRLPGAPAASSGLGSDAVGLLAKLTTGERAASRIDQDMALAPRDFLPASNPCGSMVAPLFERPWRSGCR